VTHITQDVRGLELALKEAQRMLFTGSRGAAETLRKSAKLGLEAPA
jgi:hypothetical protein